MPKLEDFFAQVMRRASVVMRQVRCAFVSEEGLRCRSAATGECAICHEPFCIPHAMHSVDLDNSDMVCLLCINEYAELVKKQGRPNRAQEQRATQPAWAGIGGRAARVRPGPAPRVNPPPPSPPDLESLRRAAFAVMGLDPGASEEEIKAAFKALAKKHHPDRHRSEEAKAKATKRFIEIKTAFEFLQKTKQERAA
jgi:DnaJ-domain-containing protein 1